MNAYYNQLLNKAMLDIVRAILTNVQADGLMPEQHFYITFNTKSSAVKISDQMREEYPHALTIVLQHQFKDLVVGIDRFCVTISFNKIYEKIEIPFNALISFSDPSADFNLKFDILPNIIDVDLTQQKQKSQLIDIGVRPSLDNLIILDKFKAKKTSDSNNPPKIS
jgi:hypothetical protein